MKALEGCSGGGGGGGGKGQKTASAASVDAANAKQATKYRGRKSWREKEEGAREDNYLQHTYFWARCPANVASHPVKIDGTGEKK